MSSLDINANPETSGVGILPAQTLRQMISDGCIYSAEEINDELIQPASLDMRLGEVAWRVQSSFLPGIDATVEDKVTNLGMHRIDITNGAVLEKRCVLSLIHI